MAGKEVIIARGVLLALPAAEAVAGVTFGVALGQPTLGMVMVAQGALTLGIVGLGAIYNPQEKRTEISQLQTPSRVKP